nr:MarR family transcriptional regulator [Paenibacillus sp. MMS18-CY102]
MDKSTLFHQMVAFLTAVHESQHEFSKDIPMGDITPVQYGILEYIAVQQLTTLSEISDCKHLSMPNASRELRKLTDKGLCERYSDAGDKRKQLIRLTSEGQAFMNEAFGQMDVKFQQRLHGLSSDQLQQISDAIGVLQSTVFRDPAVDNAKL